MTVQQQTPRLPHRQSPLPQPRPSVTRPAVGHWERGVRSLNAGQLVQIAEILHADPHWLLTGTPQKPHAGSAHRILRAANALTTVASVLNELLGEDAP